MSRVAWIALLGGALAMGMGIGVAVGLARRTAAEPPAADARSGGWRLDRAVPRMSLVDARGRPTSLAALRGRVVVLAPTLTLCHEVCPITTGAFARMRRAVAAAGLARRVAFVEVTVDPWRDSPARLRAYARLTGVHVPILTGGVARIRRFWRFFGIGFRRTPQGHPPDRDWWTGRAERFDVEHVDGVFLIGADGRERAFYSGMADVHGRLPARLSHLLGDDGRRNLAHPADPWTPAAVLEGVGRLLGRRIPFSG